MCSAERVIFALAALRKARKPPAGAQGANAVAASSEDFVRIALMAHIPDQPVFGRVKHIMDGGGQLNNAKPRAQMTTRDRYGRNGFGAQFVGKLAKLRRGKIAKVRGHFNRIK